MNRVLVDSTLLGQPSPNNSLQENAKTPNVGR